MLGFLSVSTRVPWEIGTPYTGFNPVLGFLSVSTGLNTPILYYVFGFQSRAGFSECLDRGSIGPVTKVSTRFNPVLGFLSVSTIRSRSRPNSTPSFNPVLGFLSVSTSQQCVSGLNPLPFQSRAGFSECLDIS